MVICAIGEPSRADGWNCSSCDLKILKRLPKELVFDPPKWHEGRIEASFVRKPTALIRGLGIRQPKRLVVLKQVDDIDIYLSADDQLHLFEVKGLRGPGRMPYGRWPSALNQIVGYWEQRRGWLYVSEGMPVTLWGLCPIRWRDDGPRIPADWKSTVASITSARLSYNGAPALNLAFYSLFQSAGQRVLILWRADEEPPRVDLHAP